MQHLQRGPERVHLCRRNKPKSCHIEIKHTKVQQSQFVITIISWDRLCSRRVTASTFLQLQKADTVIDFPKPSPTARFRRKQTILKPLRHVIDFTDVPFSEQNM